MDTSDSINDTERTQILLVISEMCSKFSLEDCQELLKEKTSKNQFYRKEREKKEAEYLFFIYVF